MPEYRESRQLPHTSRQMFDLVADVAAYPAFLPWVEATRIRSRTSRHDGAEVMDMDMTIAFGAFRSRFGSRDILWPEERRIDILYLDGPLRRMQACWRFRDVTGGCLVAFSVEFELANPLLRAVVGTVFGEAMRRMVAAFEARAAELYAATG